MANLNGFNPNDYEPDDYMKLFEPMPTGLYPMAITDSERKPTKVGDGSYLEIELTVVSGQYAGRKVWDRLCIEHHNEQAQTIARQKLSAICRAVGVMNAVDSSELHNIPLGVKVKHTFRDDNGEPTNEVQFYEILKQQGAPQQQQSAPPQQQGANQGAADSATPPWSRG